MVQLQKIVNTSPRSLDFIRLTAGSHYKYLSKKRYKGSYILERLTGNVAKVV